MGMDVRKQTNNNLNKSFIYNKCYSTSPTMDHSSHYEPLHGSLWES